MTCNDLGISTLMVESCFKVPVNHLLNKCKQEWRKQLMSEGVTIGATKIQFSLSKVENGGIRLWFACPKCQRRCGTLYQDPISQVVACRLCLGLRYKKQRYKGMVEALIT